ncbi:hypothetical protein P4B35_13695 [Pontiellaceae bacterium B12227]|nr:hypothetical protein [Pontiellaceae bacterium B12227]
MNQGHLRKIILATVETNDWIAADGFEGDTGTAVLNRKRCHNPADSNAWFQITGITNNTVYFEPSSFREYTLYWSTNLAQDVWTPSAAARPGGGGSDSLTATSAPLAAFYKVEVGLLSESEEPINQ